MLAARRRRRSTNLRAPALAATLGSIVFAGEALHPRDARAVADPTIEWQSITSNRFVVTFPKPLAPIAQRVAAIAEHAHATLSPVLGWQPTQRTQILLTDDTDSANGSATSLPYNTVRLFVTAPDDLSALADYDDWYTELVTHEYTHILHTDHISGLPAIYNAIFGKTYSPNQLQPRWILEGLAVLEESRFTAGGRERSSTFDMSLRADVLEEAIAPIDQISHNPRRFPGGNLWYLYGSHFLQWIQDQYGSDALKQVAEDYGAQIIPYGINRAIFRATGKTYVELYAGWTAFMKTRYEAQRAVVVARGLREGRRITAHGYQALHPRYAPVVAALDTDQAADPPLDRRLVYARSDGHSTDGLYALDRPKGASSYGDASLLTRTSGASSANFLPNGDLLYDSFEVSRHVYDYWDLFRRPAREFGATATQGKRLTVGVRGTEPSVSPDGNRVAFTVNGGGTTSLAIAEVDVDGAGTLGPVRTVLQSPTYDQVYTPRWSPDGRTIALSAWSAGGYRDVELFDVATSAVTALTHDRALDTGPVFSPDGKTLFFSSDRTGIANIYAYDLATKALKQVTNVVNGAFQPEVSPDGRHLAYVGYTHLGYDLFELDLDATQWLDGLPYVDDRPPPSKVPTTLDLPVTPYDPLPTLRPYAWTLASQPDAYGQALLITTTGGDLVGHHAFAAALGISLSNAEPSLDATYVYRRLPFDMRVHGYRYLAPRGGYRFSDVTPAWNEQTLGGDVGVSYPINTSFTSQALAASYSFAQFKPVGELPRTYDPYAKIPVYPQTGFIGSMHVGYSWSNVQRFLWSVGAERGFALSATIDLARKALGSDFDLFVAGYSAAAFVPMPWARHHVVALHAQGGASVGDYDRRGAFSLGGFTDVPLPTALRNLLFQPSIALRGYKPGARVGDGYQIFNAEYRFPLLNIDRGIETLPVFLQRIYGDVFADYGDATFDALDLLHMKFGFGGEVLIDFTVGYFVDVTLRVGVARGTSADGTTQLYTALSAPF